MKYTEDLMNGMNSIPRWISESYFDFIIDKYLKKQRKEKLQKIELI